jgi:hypothetical protein
VTQLGVSGQDFSATSAAPHLRNALNNSAGALSTTAVVPEVHGDIEMDRLQQFLEEKCGGRVISADAASMSLLKTKELISDQADICFSWRDPQ